jgi:hypothetical protein
MRFSQPTAGWKSNMPTSTSIAPRAKFPLWGWGIIIAGCTLAVCFLGHVYGWTVLFILPDGFQGEFRLVLDPEQGTEPRWNWGCYTYHIPPIGILRVKTLHPFEPWHFQRAKFENGQGIPNAYDVDDLPLGDQHRRSFSALIHGGGMGQTGDGPYEITFFVGSSSEYEDWIDASITFQK